MSFVDALCLEVYYLKGLHYHVIDFVLALNVLFGFPSVYLHTRIEGVKSTDYSAKVSPTEHLEWHACFGEYQCARLDVPMDYNGVIDKRVAVALIKLPAKVPVTDHRYGGPILLNPGGPGGSGVNFIFRFGRHVRRVVDSDLDPLSTTSLSDESSRYFDILSFDPRGINNTTPVVSCFPDEYSRLVFETENRAEGMFGTHDDVFKYKWTRARAMAEGCAARAADIDIGYYVNTPSVVMDMVQIIERHGEWVEKEADKILAGMPRLSAIQAKYDQAQSYESAASIFDRTRWQKGFEQLQYWGFSYGTILGQTFAAMQPERSLRLVIDGVCDVNDYYAGGWMKNLQDTDSILEHFFEYCYQAGPDKCPLYTGSSAADIKTLFEDTLYGLKGNPIGVPASSTEGPDIVTYSDLKRIIADVVYKPIEKLPILADLVAGLASGNASSFRDYKHDERKAPIENRQCTDPKPWSDKCSIGDDAPSAILCLDGDSITEWTPEMYQEYITQLRGQSEYMGDSWARIRLPCTAWNIRPKYTFDGPIAGNTAHPILYLGNSRDPVTPVRNAYTMSKFFNDSVVVEQDSEGHCSITNPSICTVKAVRKYFQTGEMPEKDIFCLPDVRPIIGNITDVSLLNERSQEEHELMRTYRELADLVD